MNDLVGLTEIALRFGVSRQRVEQLSRSGTFPAVHTRVGRVRVWRWSDVEAWAKSRGRDINRRAAV